MKYDAAEEQWVQDLLSGAKVRQVPAHCQEHFERDVYSRLSALESPHVFPVWNFITLTAITIALLWFSWGAIFLPTPAQSPTLEKIQSRMAERSTLITPSESWVQESLQTMTDPATVIQTQPSSAALKNAMDTIAEDLLVLEMLGEDDEFMEEMGTVESDLQMMTQPAFNQTVV